MFAGQAILRFEFDDACAAHEWAADYSLWPQVRNHMVNQVKVNTRKTGTAATGREQILQPEQMLCVHGGEQTLKSITTANKTAT